MAAQTKNFLVQTGGPNKGFEDGSKTLAWLQLPDPSRDTDGVFGTHRSKKCRKRLLFGVVYLYQTFKTTSLENIPYEPFGVANLELATFSL